MPPLPTSLIVVGLVAAWLVVLVPMVARRREHVPESDEGSAGFRVLRRASASLRRRRPVMSRTAMQSDAGMTGDDVRDGDEDWGGDDWESDRWDTDGGDDPDGSDDADDRDHRAGAEPRDGAEGGYDVEDGDGAADADLDGDKGPDARAEDDRFADEDGHPADADGRFAAADGLRGSRHRPSVHDAADEWTVEHPARVRDERPLAAARFADRGRSPDPRRNRSPELRRYRGPQPIPDRGRPLVHDRGPQPVHDRGREPEAEWQDDARFRPVPVRPGRGGFDPQADEQTKAYRYRRRRRIAMVLLAIAGLCAVLGVLGLSLAWAGSAVATVLLALYLAYLRRQVRIEESIRQRRAARLERARQIRPVYRASVAEQVRAHRTGGLRRPVTDDEADEGYRVVSHARPSAASVPPAHYGPGVVVDLDDDDPAFDDLEYYRPVTYRRAAGE